MPYYYKIKYYILLDLYLDPREASVGKLLKREVLIEHSAWEYPLVCAFCLTSFLVCLDQSGEHPSSFPGKASCAPLRLRSPSVRSMIARLGNAYCLMCKAGACCTYRDVRRPASRSDLIVNREDHHHRQGDRSGNIAKSTRQDH